MCEHVSVAEHLYIGTVERVLQSRTAKNELARAGFIGNEVGLGIGALHRRRVTVLVGNLPPSRHLRQESILNAQHVGSLVVRLRHETQKRRNIQ